MTERNKWERYDLARAALSIMVSHYAELIGDEGKKAAPDATKIHAWEDLQFELSRRQSRLLVDDEGEVEQINSTYGPQAAAVMKR
ncbi:hypothetical protein [Pseudomonas sp. AK106]|mgnify:CR=1 FL=1|jgi:hypothetical protein|nr:hypothetical protein AO263_25340 [Pseudomonas sp. NZIPFR-PS5]RYF38132.1 MAG: hypothetical protein EOO38_25270 [Cytophagaceae bacterium]